MSLEKFADVPDIVESIFIATVHESTTDPALRKALPIFANLLFDVGADTSLKEPSAKQLASRKYKDRLEEAITSGKKQSKLLGSRELATQELYQKLGQYLWLCVKQHGEDSLSEEEKEVLKKGFKNVLKLENAKAAFSHCTITEEEFDGALGQRIHYLPLLAENIDILANVRRDFDAKFTTLSSKLRRIPDTLVRTGFDDKADLI